jgi:hypothetical protein
MVLRSGQKSNQEIQQIRDAMEGGQPVVHDSVRELIVKQANSIGEDGIAMVEDIENATACSVDKPMPADVYKLIERCLASLKQRVNARNQSDAITARKEPERLKQLETVREPATMIHGSRLNKDKATEESLVRSMRTAVIEFMAAVDLDVQDGLDPDTARLWKEQVQGIVAVADIGTIAGEETVAAGASILEPRPAPRGGATDCLAPLKDTIEQAQYTMQAVARELTSPEETVLRGFGKQLGSSKREIMNLSRNLAVGQPSGIAAEATRLASEAGDAIKASREAIRAALREMGVASDISEVSGPVRPPPAASGRSVAGGSNPAARRPAIPMPGGNPRPPQQGWAVEPPPARYDWMPRPAPARTTLGGQGSAWASVRTPVATEWPSAGSRPRPRLGEEEGDLPALMRGMMSAQVNDSGWPTFSGKFMEYPPVPQRMVGIQADVPRARAR